MRDIPLSIDPRRWGPHLWSSMEAAAGAWDPKDAYAREHIILFFFSLQGIIPCPSCRKHYCKYFDKYPIQGALDSKASLFKWILRLKNQINKRNEKESIQFKDYIRSVEDKFSIKL